MVLYRYVCVLSRILLLFKAEAGGADGVGGYVRHNPSPVVRVKQERKAVGKTQAGGREGWLSVGEGDRFFG